VCVGGLLTLADSIAMLGIEGTPLGRRSNLKKFQRMSDGRKIFFGKIFSAGRQ
jgi:hypothetical protein